MASGVETVLAILASEGFEPLPKPLVVDGAIFEFDAAATGTGVSHDLVVVGGQDADAERLTPVALGAEPETGSFALTAPGESRSARTTSSPDRASRSSKTTPASC